jgi:endonuclease YncB( thermonuclease family)
MEAVNLLLGQPVVLQTGKGQGKYGRWLAKIALPGGKDFSEEMRRKGWEKKNYKET